MAVQITDGITPALTPDFPTSMGPFRAVDGDLFVVAITALNDDGAGVPNGSPNRIGVYKSADEGVTWARADAANDRDGYRADWTLPNLPLSVWFGTWRTYCAVKHPTNDEIYVVFAGLAGVVSVARFNMTAEIWTGQWDSAMPIQTSDLIADPSWYYGVYNWAAEFETTTGDFVIGYMSYFSPGRKATRYLRFNGGAFGASGYLTAAPNVDGLGYFCQGNGGRVHAILNDYNPAIPDPYALGFQGIIHALAADGAGGFGGGAFQLVTGAVDGILWQPSSTRYGAMIAVVLYDIPTNASRIYYANSAPAPVWVNAPAAVPPTNSAFWGGALVWDQSLGVVQWLYDYSLGGASDMYVRAWDGAVLGVEASLVPAADGPFSAVSAGWINLPSGTYGVVFNQSVALPGTVAAFPLFYVPSGVAPPPPPPPPPPGPPTSSVGAGSETSMEGIGGGGEGEGGFLGVPGLLMPLVVGKNYIPTLTIYDKMLRKLCECHARMDWMAMKCPWLGMWDGASMPNGAIEYLERGVILTPGPGVDNLVLQMDVPIGYESLLYGLVLHYTGTGFVEGSGDIVWRVRVGNHWLKGLGNSLTSRGVPAQPFHLADGERVKGGTRMQVWVNVPNISGLIQVGLSNIVCALQGWHYPV